jgi:tubulin-specific chaperone C
MRAIFVFWRERRLSDPPRHAGASARAMDPSQTTAEWLREFDDKIAAARRRIEAAEAVQEVDSVCAAIDALHVDLAAAVCNLPAYDVRRAHETLGEVVAERQLKSEKLAPRQPFRFRHRRQRAAPAAAAPAAAASDRSVIDASPADGSAVSAAGGESRVVSIADRGPDGGSGAPIAFGPGTLRHRDVSLTRLRGVTVQLADVSGAVRAVDLVDCTLYIGPVAGSVHLTGCLRCQIHVAARQVRVHKSSECVFYVLARSSPIIEDCSRLSFAPYALAYDGLGGQVRDAGLVSAAADAERVLRDVRDFSWLRDGDSPNWAFVEAADRPPAVRLDV